MLGQKLLNVPGQEIYRTGHQDSKRQRHASNPKGVVFASLADPECM